MLIVPNDKVIVVTGGSRGIGAAIVTHLAYLGYTVYGTYNSNPEQAQLLATHLTNEGAQVHFIQMNVASEESVRLGFEHIVKEKGRIDGLVNNAGITKDTLLIRMSEQDWDDVLDTNLKGAFLCSKAVSRPMMSQRSGRIINISSIVGLRGNAGQVNYSSSKAGMIGLTKSLAQELASRNILVNCIAPGYIETDMTEKLNEEQRKAFSDKIPLKRSAKPKEIASVVSFFLNEESSYITGQVLCVDGGLAM
jgi:3-oxoacyl-[acyl-carrier protein] reductase